jgi:hypothetical protein
MFKRTLEFAKEELASLSFNYSTVASLERMQSYAMISEETAKT